MDPQPFGHPAHRVTPINNLCDGIAFELVCESARGHLVLLASKVTKQGVYKSWGYSDQDCHIPFTFIFDIQKTMKNEGNVL